MKKYLSFFILLLFTAVGCTDLEEQILDEARNEQLLRDPSAAESILAPVYARMNQLFNSHEDWFLIQELSTDEAIVPYRGGTDWFNGGILIEAYRHTWTTNHRTLANVWNQITQGIARSAIAVNTLATIDVVNPNISAYAAEAKAMGALFNYCLLDAYGLCLYKDPAQIYSTTETSRIMRGEEAVEFLLAELDAALPDLKEKGEIGSGRFTKGAAEALKARILLNKAVYVDPYAATHSFQSSDMDAVIQACNAVINSGGYALESQDYFSIFDLDNRNHPELIFAVDHRDDANNGGRLIWFTLARNQHLSLVNLTSVGTDGASTTSDFYHTWDGNHDDPRFYKEYIPQDGLPASIPDAAYRINRGFLVGQQYGIVLNSDRSDFKRADNGELLIEKLYNTQRTGEAVDFTVEVAIEQQNGHSNGVRVSKYEADQRSTNGRNFSTVNQPLLRLADVYLMRAEAYLRKGEVASALSDLNALRSARNHPRQFSIADVSLDAIYRERGYELYWEMIRRTDMIRFGKFEDTWTSKTNNEVHRRLFPIPQAVMDANPNFIQQNKDY